MIAGAHFYLAIISKQNMLRKETKLGSQNAVVLSSSLFNVRKKKKRSMYYSLSPTYCKYMLGKFIRNQIPWIRAINKNTLTFSAFSHFQVTRHSLGYFIIALYSLGLSYRGLTLVTFSGIVSVTVIGGEQACVTCTWGLKSGRWCKREEWTIMLLDEVS